MTRPVPDRWIQPPRQERSQRTLERLLDVAEQLIEDKGFEDTTLAEVASRAGSSVSAFYRRFRDKDALLHALHERYLADCTANVDRNLDPDRWRGMGVAEIVSDFCAFAVEFAGWRQGFHRAAYRRALADPDFAARERTLHRHIRDRLSQLLLARRDEIRHPDLAVAVEFVWLQVSALLTRRFVTASVQQFPLSDAQLATETTRSCLAYLDVVNRRRETQG